MSKDEINKQELLFDQRYDLWMFALNYIIEHSFMACAE